MACFQAASPSTGSPLLNRAPAVLPGCDDVSPNIQRSPWYCAHSAGGSVMLEGMSRAGKVFAAVRRAVYWPACKLSGHVWDHDYDGFVNMQTHKFRGRYTSSYCMRCGRVEKLRGIAKHKRVKLEPKIGKM